MTTTDFILIGALVLIVIAVRVSGVGRRPAPARTGVFHVKAFRGSPANTALAAASYQAGIAGEGWLEANRTYSPGSWGCAAFLLALLLAVFLIGILIFIYLVIVKPAGTLVVTYTRPVELAPVVPATHWIVS